MCVLGGRTSQGRAETSSDSDSASARAPLRVSRAERRSIGMRRGRSDSSTSRPEPVTRRMRKNDTKEDSADFTTVIGTVSGRIFDRAVPKRRASASRCASARASAAKIDRLCTAFFRHRSRWGFGLVDHARRDLDFADADTVEPPQQARQHRALSRAIGEQVDRMDRAALPNAVDAADALFEPNRIPRQLEVDDQPAVALEIESFRAGIGCDHDVGCAAGKVVHRLPPLLRRLAAVKRCDRAMGLNRGANRVQRVAVFGEYDERLADAPDDPW